METENQSESELIIDEKIEPAVIEFNASLIKTFDENNEENMIEYDVTSMNSPDENYVAEVVEYNVPLTKNSDEKSEAVATESNVLSIKSSDVNNETKAKEYNGPLVKSSDEKNVAEAVESNVLSINSSSEMNKTDIMEYNDPLVKNSDEKNVAEAVESNALSINSSGEMNITDVMEYNDPLVKSSDEKSEAGAIESNVILTKSLVERNEMETNIPPIISLNIEYEPEAMEHNDPLVKSSDEKSEAGAIESNVMLTKSLVERNEIETNVLPIISSNVENEPDAMESNVILTKSLGERNEMETNIPPIISSNVENEPEGMEYNDPLIKSSDEKSEAGAIESNVILSKSLGERNEMLTNIPPIISLNVEYEPEAMEYNDSLVKSSDEKSEAGAIESNVILSKSLGERNEMETNIAPITNSNVENEPEAMEYNDLLLKSSDEKSKAGAIESNVILTKSLGERNEMETNIAPITNSNVENEPEAMEYNDPLINSSDEKSKAGVIESNVILTKSLGERNEMETNIAPITNSNVENEPEAMEYNDPLINSSDEKSKARAIESNVMLTKSLVERNEIETNVLPIISSNVENEPDAMESNVILTKSLGERNEMETNIPPIISSNVENEPEGMEYNDPLIKSSDEKSEAGAIESNVILSKSLGERNEMETNIPPIISLNVEYEPEAMEYNDPLLKSSDEKSKAGAIESSVILTKSLGERNEMETNIAPITNSNVENEPEAMEYDDPLINSSDEKSKAGAIESNVILTKSLGERNEMETNIAPITNSNVENEPEAMEYNDPLINSLDEKSKAGAIESSVILTKSLGERNEMETNITPITNSNVENEPEAMEYNDPLINSSDEKSEAGPIESNVILTKSLGERNEMETNIPPIISSNIKEEPEEMEYNDPLINSSDVKSEAIESNVILTKSSQETNDPVASASNVPLITNSDKKNETRGMEYNVLLIENKPPDWSSSRLKKFISRDIYKDKNEGKGIQFLITLKNSTACAVYYDNYTSCKTAFSDLTGVVIDGNKIKVSIYTEYRKNWSTYFDEEQEEDLTGLYTLSVRNKPLQWSSAEVIKFVSQTCQSEDAVKGIQIIKMGKKCSWCFILYDNINDATLALSKLAATQVDGRQLIVALYAGGDIEMPSLNADITHNKTNNELKILNKPVSWNYLRMHSFMQVVCKSITSTKCIDNIQTLRGSRKCAIYFKDPVSCSLAFKDLQSAFIEGKKVSVIQKIRKEASSSHTDKESKDDKHFILLIRDKPRNWNTSQLKKFMAQTCKSAGAVDGILYIRVVRNSTAYLVMYKNIDDCIAAFNEMAGAIMGGNKIEVSMQKGRDIQSTVQSDMSEANDENLYSLLMTNKPENWYHSDIKSFLAKKCKNSVAVNAIIKIKLIDENTAVIYYDCLRNCKFAYRQLRGILNDENGIQISKVKDSKDLENKLANPSNNKKRGSSSKPSCILFIKNKPLHWDSSEVKDFIFKTSKTNGVIEGVLFVKIIKESTACLVYYNDPTNCNVALNELSGAVMDGNNIEVTMLIVTEDTLSSCSDELQEDEITDYFAVVIKNKPRDWSFIDMKKYMSLTCKNIPQLNDHLVLVRTNTGCTKCTAYFNNPTTCTLVFNEMSGEMIQGQKIVISLLKGLPVSMPKKAAAKASLKYDAFDVPKTKPDEEPETYGLSKQFLNALNINLPLTNIVGVSNLSPLVDEAKLQEVFSYAGHVTRIFLKEALFCARIHFDHPVEAVQAISMLNGQVLYEKSMNVTMDIKPIKPFIPKGVSRLGKGLGENDGPLCCVRANVELKAMKELMMQQYNKLKQDQANQLMLKNPVLEPTMISPFNPVATLLINPNVQPSTSQNLTYHTNPQQQALNNKQKWEQNTANTDKLSRKSSESSKKDRKIDWAEKDTDSDDSGGPTDRRRSRSRSYEDKRSEKRRSRKRSRHDRDDREQKRQKRSDIVVFSNLPSSVTLQTLKSKMRELGDVKLVKMISNRKALVRFRSSRDAESCLKEYSMTQNWMEGSSVSNISNGMLKSELEKCTFGAVKIMASRNKNLVFTL